MKRFSILGSLVGTLGLFGSGCVANHSYYEPVEEGDYEFFEDLGGGYMGNLQLLEGRLAGDIGPVTGVDSEATLLEGFDDGSFADVQVIAETERGVVMSWVEIVGGTDHPALQPGFSQTFRENDFGFDSRNLHVRVVNCSGDEAYDWDYDQPADEVVVQVEEGPLEETLLVNFTTRTFEVDPFTGIREPTATEVNGNFVVRR